MTRALIATQDVQQVAAGWPPQESAVVGPGQGFPANRKPSLAVRETGLGGRLHTCYLDRAISSLIAALLALAALSGTANAATRQPSGPCDGRASDLKPSYGTVIIDRRVTQLLRCAGHRYGVSIPRLICTADRESSFWPWADSGSSKGVMQHLGSLWPGRVRTYWPRAWAPNSYPPSYFNARANIIVAARMVRAGGWSPWSGGCV